MAKKKLETTFYRFQSEIRAFLSGLLKHPITAQPHKYLKDRNFNKTKTINVLIKRGILERHEKILDPTNSEEKEAKYTVKYKVVKKDFEKKIHRIFTQYFEENLPDEEKINENKEVTMPLIRGVVYKTGLNGGETEKSKLKENMKRIYVTESQFRMLQECMNIPNMGDVLNEDGEGGGIAGATTCGASSGEYVGKNAFDEKGPLMKGPKTHSAPAKMGLVKEDSENMGTDDYEISIDFVKIIGPILKKDSLIDEVVYTLADEFNLGGEGEILVHGVFNFYPKPTLISTDQEEIVQKLRQAFIQLRDNGLLDNRLANISFKALKNEVLSITKESFLKKYKDDVFGDFDDFENDEEYV